MYRDFKLELYHVATKFRETVHFARLYCSVDECDIRRDERIQFITFMKILRLTRHRPHIRLGNDITLYRSVGNVIADLPIVHNIRTRIRVVGCPDTRFR